MASFALLSVNCDRGVICRVPSSSSPIIPSTLLLNSLRDGGGTATKGEFHIVTKINNSCNTSIEKNGANNGNCTESTFTNTIKGVEDDDTSDDDDDDNTLDIMFHDLPRHIAFICDGNLRWSEQKQQRGHESMLQLPGLLSSFFVPPSMRGHAAGADRVVRLIDTLVSMRQKHYQQQRRLQQLNGKKEKKKEHNNSSIQYCTLFAFSTENWSRPYHEVAGLFQLLEQMAIHYSKHDTAVLQDGKVQIQILGNLEDTRIPTSMRNELRNLEVKSKVACDERRRRRRRRRRKGNDGTASTATYGSDVGDDHGDVSPNDVVDDVDVDDDDVLTICLAINYGGRADILRAATELALSIINESSSSPSPSSSNTAIMTKAVNEMELSKRLCTSSIPDVDLIVRTGGERRLSNFFLWEGAYAELYFTDVFWPDFDEEELKKALVWYGKQNRRYGGRKDDGTS